MRARGEKKDMRQRPLDFTPQALIDGKKTERLTIACPKELITYLDGLVPKFRNLTRAELAYKFVVEGVADALLQDLLSKIVADKTYADVMNQL